MAFDNLNETEQVFYDGLKSSDVPTSEEQLKTKFENMAQDYEVPFNNSSSNAVWWSFLRGVFVTPFLTLIEYFVRSIMPQFFVKYATGTYLDWHGWRLGLERKTETKAKGVVRFSRTESTNDLVINAGVIIQTAPINGTQYAMVVENDTTLSAGELFVDVPCVAQHAGANYNLGSNYYVLLAESITGITSVTNTEQWLLESGTDNETDDNYRNRLRAQFTNVSDHHINSVYKRLIADKTGMDEGRIFIDHTLAPRGAGSADALILFDVGSATTEILNDVNDYIIDQGFHGHGDDIQVKALPLISVDISLNVWVPTGTDQAAKDSLQSDIENMIRAAFRENNDYQVTLTYPNNRFSFGKLSGELMRRFVMIESIEWAQGDIVSGWNVPTINNLTITLQEEF